MMLLTQLQCCCQIASNMSCILCMQDLLKAVVAAVYVDGGLPALVKVFSKHYLACVEEALLTEGKSLKEDCLAAPGELHDRLLSELEFGPAPAAIAAAAAAAAAGSLSAPSVTPAAPNPPKVPTAEELAAQKVNGNASRAWSHVIQDQRNCESIVRQVLLPSMERWGVMMSPSAREVLVPLLIDMLHATSSSSPEEVRLREGRVRLLGRTVNEVALQMSLLTSAANKEPLAKQLLQKGGAPAGDILGLGVEKLLDTPTFLSKGQVILCSEDKVRLFRRLQLEHHAAAATEDADATAAAALQAFLQEYDGKSTFVKSLQEKLWDGIVGTLCWGAVERHEAACCFVIKMMWSDSDDA
jgi:hypothetical protein